jgi:predicted ribosomally synthesized peptide with nif11-like leader
MSINNATKFIKDSQVNSSLRKKVNELNPEELKRFMDESGYQFTTNDFDDSVNMLHLKCQTEEEAENLMQIAMWFSLINYKKY